MGFEVLRSGYTGDEVDSRVDSVYSCEELLSARLLMMSPQNPRTWQRV